MVYLKNRIAVASFGTFLEWTEFTYYAYIASKIAHLFFPGLNKDLAVIAAFAVFAIAYIFRPLGALFFGFIGDKYGRKPALQVSISLMGLSALLVACLPVYNQIGISAPLLLLLLRSLQGFAVSGEFNGSAIYLMEHDKNRPCYAGSWTSFSAASGMMFGSLLSALIELPMMPEWAWRLPFLLGALSCVMGFLLRTNFSESPQYLNREQHKANKPLSLLFKSYKYELVQCILLVAGLAAYLYTMNIYYGTHLSLYSNLSESRAKFIVTFGQTLVMCCIFFFAPRIDAYNTQKIMRYGLTGFMFTAPLCYLLPQTNSFGLILLGQIPYALCNTLLSFTIFKIIHDLFPVEVRYTGVSLGWSISMAFFGGTAPLIAHYLQESLGFAAAPALYVMLAASLSLFTLEAKIPFLKWAKVQQTIS